MPGATVTDETTTTSSAGAHSNPATKNSKLSPSIIAIIAVGIISGVVLLVLLIWLLGKYYRRRRRAMQEPISWDPQPPPVRFEIESDDSASAYHDGSSDNDHGIGAYGEGTPMLQVRNELQDPVYLPSAPNPYAVRVPYQTGAYPVSSSLGPAYALYESPYKAAASPAATAPIASSRPLPEPQMQMQEIHRLPALRVDTGAGFLIPPAREYFYGTPQSQVGAQGHPSPGQSVSVTDTSGVAVHNPVRGSVDQFLPPPPIQLDCIYEESPVQSPGAYGGAVWR
jgi:hypothetical protein